MEDKNIKVEPIIGYKILKDLEKASYVIGKLDGKLDRFCKKYRIKPSEAIVKLQELSKVFDKVEVNS